MIIFICILFILFSFQFLQAQTWTPHWPRTQMFLTKLTPDPARTQKEDPFKPFKRIFSELLFSIRKWFNRNVLSCLLLLFKKVSVYKILTKIIERKIESYRADRKELVGVVHHSNEKIEENNDVDDWEASKHYKSPKSCKFLDAVQFKII